MAELEIKVGADVAGAISGLDRLQGELNQTGKAAAALGNEAEKAGAKILKLPSTVNQATFTLNNFTRVVQDAPYGIRGVANNIDPLVESFTRLRAQTGSTTLAFRAMIGTLAGPAGILLAVSSITSALTYFGDKLFSTGENGKESYKKLADAAQRFKEVQDSLSENVGTIQTVATQNLSGEIAQVQALSSVVRDQTLSYQQRNNALNELQRINKNYFGDLSLEKTSIEQLTQRVNEYTQALVAAEVVKLYKERVSAAVVSLNDQIQAERQLQAQLNSANAEKEAATIATQKQTKTDLERENALTRLGKAQSNVDIINAKLTTQNNKITDAQNALGRFNKELRDAVLLSTQFKPLEPVAAGKKDKFKFDFDLIPGISEYSKIVAKQAGALERITTKEYDRALQNAFKKPRTIKFNVGINLSESVLEFQEYLDEVGKQYDASVKRINDAIANIQIESLATIGVALGEVFATGDVQNAFQAFGNVVASGLEIIGKELIRIGILSEIVQSALKNLFAPQGGPLAIAAGIGLVAASAALRSSLSNGIKARALGGPVSGGEPYLVGERGPELFVPSVSGGIVPNNSVGSFLGGRMSGGGSSVLRGQDILLAYARTQRSQLRVNG